MDQPFITAPSSAASTSVASVWLPRMGVLILIAIIGYFVAEMGLRWRHWVWDTTASIRFVDDIDRGFHWGRISATEGYLNQYEKMQGEQPGDSNWLDYAPLRLGVMAAWGKWSLKHYPNVGRWHEDRSYALTAPVLGFNLFMEIIGLIGAFFLTRLWAIRSQASIIATAGSLGYFYRGCVPGLVAVLLLWFNPAVVLSAYGWPTWDLWIIPLFLLAALFASLEYWFCAGVMIGIGAMFKGQQLLAVPLLVIWSLTLMRPLMTVRFLAGVVFAIGLIASPWLLSYIPPDQLAHAREIQASFGQPYQAPAGTFAIARTVDAMAVTWVVGMLISASLLPWLSWITLDHPTLKTGWRKVPASPWTWRAVAALIAFGWTLWPWLIRRNRGDLQVGISAGCLLACLVLLIRPRGIACLAAGATGVALLLCLSVFHGSSAWYDCGFHFGTIHWPHLFVGLTDNLPAILSRDFDWPWDRLDTPLTIPAETIFRWPAAAIVYPIGTVLQTLFIATFILSAIGLGIQARRKDSRVLITLVAPWLLFFCFPPQIHERYLLFAAASSCICAGASTGMTLLGILLSLMTFIMTLHVMLADAANKGRLHQLSMDLSRQFPRIFSSNSGRDLLQAMNGTHPDMGYAILLCGLIFLYFSIAPARQKR